MLGRCWKTPSESWSTAVVWLTNFDSCIAVIRAMICASSERSAPFPTPMTVRAWASCSGPRSDGAAKNARSSLSGAVLRRWAVAVSIRPVGGSP